ncbi:unnamed protein product [Symbiodinium sp. KB8]|nr:unnamed protein product [Symbiodinium sp. KB8]
MVRLSDIPALGINLDKRPDRLKNVRKFAKTMGFYSFQKITAVDGHHLEDCDGQYRKVSASLFRLTWTGDGTRCKGYIKMSASLQKLASKKLVSRWSLYGCSQSHIKALQRTVSLFTQGFPAVCILEDDVATPAEAERKKIDRILETLEKRSKGWKLLMLGGEPRTDWATKTRHKAIKGIDGVRWAERVYQSHAYIIRDVALARWLLDTLSTKHLVADGATAAAQKFFHGVCFFCQPSLVVQSGFGSDLLTNQRCACSGTNPIVLTGLSDSPGKPLGGGGQSGWSSTWINSKKGKSQMQHKIPKKTMKKKAMKSKTLRKNTVATLRKDAGAQGGSVHAGSGSTKKDIAKKVRWLQRNQPSQRAARAHGISYKLWKRVCSDDA